MGVKGIQEIERVKRLLYLSKYGSCQTGFLCKWNEICPSCESSKGNGVPSLQNLSLNILANYESFSPAMMPISLCNVLMQVALAKNSSTVKNFLKNWPFESFSLVNILSDHNFQCFIPWKREQFAKKLFYSYMEIILNGEECTLLTLDIRGTVISDEDELAKIFELLNKVRELESNSFRQIFLDIEISEDLFDQLTSVLVYNPEINPESKSTLHVHLGHFQSCEGSMRQGQGIKSYLRKMISFTTSKLESLYIPNTFLKNAGLRKILNELKMPKYQNLVALNFANNDLDFQSCTMTVDLFAQCIGDLPQLRSLNLSQNPVSGCLEFLLCNLKYGLLDLRVAGCELNSEDLVYLMGSIHAKSLIVLDISENSFESKTELNNFISAFKAQMIAIEGEACGMEADELVELATTLQDFSVLYYVSFVGYWMTIEELVPVVRELCLCQSLKIVVLSLPVDVDFDIDDVNRVKNLVSPVESVIEQCNGSFSIHWI
ncbi:uncharacterized protein LOC136040939 [Artemia franciscana]|uniref:Uncharacterized protein n=1 Tax=Artemia franciscana TaxID=6661 RepID=A0AA88HJW9_ARTSF|nr:hypothetical protein QYM36_009200 [Artemia franciscana]KAK2713246.1 hypothetical protein QYM36_009200 [Artemia franciscana]